MQAHGKLLARWFLAEIIFSTLKMEAMYSPETSVDTQLTTLRYIPEDSTLLSGYFPGGIVEKLRKILIMIANLRT
jgi:hypothetical protein